MQKVIIFNKVGYEPFLDFIKAYAILCVLIGHTFPMLNQMGYFIWCGMQVPLFILIQVFHVFKKNTQSVEIKKLWYRILLPYLLIQIIPLLYACYNEITGNAHIISYVMRGGAGLVLTIRGYTFS